MASLPRGSLHSASDDALVRSIQTLHYARSVLQEIGAPKDDPQLKEIDEGLRQMKAEVQRRGLSVPEMLPDARVA